MAAKGSWLSTGIVTSSVCWRQDIGNCLTILKDSPLCLSNPFLLFPHSPSLCLFFLCHPGKQLQSHFPDLFFFLTDSFASLPLYKNKLLIYAAYEFMKHQCEFSQSLKMFDSISWFLNLTLVSFTSGHCLEIRQAADHLCVLPQNSINSPCPQFTPL